MATAQTIEGAQYLRKFSLVVSDDIGNALDLSAMRCVFKVEQQNIENPNTLNCVVYNLSSDTEKRIQNEFTKVTLQAGYEGGNYGVIFEGSILQARHGRENQTDTYLDILAADGDLAYNFSVINTSIRAGSLTIDRLNEALATMSPNGISKGFIDSLPETRLARGVTEFGMARDTMRSIAQTNGAQWGFVNGALELVKNDSYVADVPATLLTSASGMIGLPEQMEDGIHIRCLLNPSVKINRVVQIDNKSIQRYQLSAAYKPPVQQFFLPSIADDGFYRVIVCNFRGDTRGTDWYNEMICIDVKGAIPPSLLNRYLVQ